MKILLKSNLQQNGISIIGEYRPVSDINRWIIVISSTKLERAVETTGGPNGFGAALRIAISKESDKTKVSYTNPHYWGNAYFRTDYPKVAAHFISLAKNLRNQ